MPGTKIFCWLTLWAVTLVGEELKRPRPEDIRQFVANPASREEISDSNYFTVTRADLEKILKNWHQVSPDHWSHGYSHVGFGARTGHIILRDGRKVRWLVKLGGLAYLQFPDRAKLHLALEKTDWPFK